MPLFHGLTMSYANLTAYRTKECYLTQKFYLLNELILVSATLPLPNNLGFDLPLVPMWTLYPRPEMGLNTNCDGNI